MPLSETSSAKSLQKNIKTEINAGKNPKQAAAIAYSVQNKAKSAGDNATIALLTRLLGALKKLRKSTKVGDAHIDDPKKWITVNGASIPVGKGGELGGAAGEAIQSGQKEGSSSSAGHKKQIASLRKEAKEAGLTPDSRREFNNLIKKADGHRAVVEAYESGDKKKALELAHKVGALQEDYSGGGMAKHKEDAERLIKAAEKELKHGKEVYSKNQG